jgi:hypothetical protein
MITVGEFLEEDREEAIKLYIACKCSLIKMDEHLTGGNLKMAEMRLRDYEDSFREFQRLMKKKKLHEGQLIQPLELLE